MHQNLIMPLFSNTKCYEAEKIKTLLHMWQSINYKIQFIHHQNYEKSNLYDNNIIQVIALKDQPCKGKFMRQLEKLWDT